MVDEEKKRYDWLMEQIKKDLEHDETECLCGDFCDCNYGTPFTIVDFGIYKEYSDHLTVEEFIDKLIEDETKN